MFWLDQILQYCMRFPNQDTSDIGLHIFFFFMIYLSILFLPIMLKWELSIMVVYVWKHNLRTPLPYKLPLFCLSNNNLSWIFFWISGIHVPPSSHSFPGMISFRSPFHSIPYSVPAYYFMTASINITWMAFQPNLKNSH